MQRLLLTGANGFVGRLLTPLLQQDGYHVTALVGHDSPAASSADAQVTCDLRHPCEVQAAVAQATPSHIVHLAAISHVPTSFRDPLLTWQTNVMGSLHLLEAMRLWTPNAFVLFASSSEVYGATFKTGTPLGEESPCQPLNPYAASKLAAETAFREYFRQGIRGMIARPFNHIGAGQSPDFVTAAFARQIALIEAGRQEPILKVGNLQASRDFLDVLDVCHAYRALLALSTRTEYPRCLNIASGQPRKICDVLEQLLQLSTAAITVELDSQRLRPSDIPLAAGDTRLLRAYASWQPTISLETTLRQLLEYWRLQVGATTP
jgi:GDP-4-dehydro-6-deoxy-D-mannose reductase